jgi:hypothetical protein
MKDELIKIIAKYLKTETIVAGVPGEKVVEFGGVLNQGHFTHAGFCQEVAAEIAKKLLPIVGEKDLPYDELFDHMANVYGLMLIQGELGDIIHIARGSGQKTGWEDAPSWANYRTVDKTGQVTFWERQPHAHLLTGYWCDDSGGNRKYLEVESWQYSVQERPK